MNILAEKIDDSARIPTRAHLTDAGCDFFSLTEEALDPNERKLLSTGIRLKIPKSTVLFLKDKSGLAVKNGIHIMAGVIDEEYRGEIKVLAINLSSEQILIEKGQKICQGVLLPVSVVEIEEVTDISIDTSRGEGGFGSTGNI